MRSLYGGLFWDGLKLNRVLPMQPTELEAISLQFRMEVTTTSES
jgi:hypothetical protein